MTDNTKETLQEKIVRIKLDMAAQIAELEKQTKSLKEEMKSIKNHEKSAKIANQKKERILNMGVDGLLAQNIVESEIMKVHLRIPKWARSPHQINHKILRNYFELLKQNDFVYIYDLEIHSRTIRSFKSNFDQMKIISDHNHAKVFEVINDRVYLWEPVKSFILKEFKLFLKL